MSAAKGFSMTTDAAKLAADEAATRDTGCGDLDRFPVEHHSEKEQRSRRIAARRTQAELLRAATTQEAFRTQVRLALRDLDEAAMWLNATGSLGSASASGIVDALLTLGGCRLDLVRNLLRTFGPEAASPTTLRESVDR